MPVRRSPGPSCCRTTASASARSSGVVTFRFSTSPSATRTVPPNASTSAASSLACTPARRARSRTSRSSAARKACGVWVSQMVSRSRVCRTIPLVTTLTVSRVGSAAVAAPVSRAACSTRRTRSALASGRAASCTTTHSAWVTTASPAATAARRPPPPPTPPGPPPPAPRRRSPAAPPPPVPPRSPWGRPRPACGPRRRDRAAPPPPRRAPRRDRPPRAAHAPVPCARLTSGTVWARRPCADPYRRRGGWRRLVRGGPPPVLLAAVCGGGTCGDVPLGAGEDHSAGDGLQDAGDDHIRGLPDVLLSPPHDDHRAVLQVPDALPGLLAILHDVHGQLLAR